MQNQSNGFYNSEQLKMLSRVLEQVLAAAIDGGAITDGEKQELGSRLGKIIMDRFTAGETDPDRQKTIALESIQRR